MVVSFLVILELLGGRKFQTFGASSPSQFTVQGGYLRLASFGQFQVQSVLEGQGMLSGQIGGHLKVGLL